MNAKTLIVNQSLAERARIASQDHNKRLKNWGGPRPCDFEVMLGHVRMEKFLYRGHFKGWIGHNYIPLYTSVLAADNHRATYTYGFTGEMCVRTLSAPSGTEWDHDGSLVLSADYTVEWHPQAQDLVARDFARRAKAGLRDARIKRAAHRELVAQQLQDALIMERELESVRVNLYDSRRAGNCVEGTLRYAETRLHIPRESILAAPWLMGVSASRLDNSEPAQRAIRQAWLRETTVTI